MWNYKICSEVCFFRRNRKMLRGKTECVRAKLLPVLLVEALELPISVERANMQRPHADNYIRHG